MKFLSKLLLTLSIVAFGFVSFSEASQLFLYTKNNANSSNKGELAWIFDSGVNYTQYITVNKNGFSGSIKIIVQSNFNCSPGNIFIYDGGQYSRYQMKYDSAGKMCITDEIVLADTSNFQFFYSSTQNTSANDVQFIFVDLDSFNNSVKPYSTEITASVSIPTTCPTIDSEYCINNNLCPSLPHIDKNYCMSEYGLIEPGSCPGVGQCPTEGFSRLSINGEDKEESLLYNVNIPDFVKYDFIHYSNQVSDLNIQGYNEDLDYIQGIIDTQNYTPTSEDFTTVFMNLIPYMKIIIFVLFLFLIWKWIKKIF